MDISNDGPAIQTQTTRPHRARSAGSPRRTATEPAPPRWCALADTRLAGGTRHSSPADRLQFHGTAAMWARPLRPGMVWNNTPSGIGSKVPLNTRQRDMSHVWFYPPKMNYQ